jgi:cell division protein FtsB
MARSSTIATPHPSNRRADAAIPPRQPGQTRSTRIHWHKVKRIAFLGALFVIGLLYISPVANWIAQSSKASDKRQEVADLNRANGSLHQQIGGLNSPDQIAVAARRLGMVRKGEQAFVIENPPSPPPPR